MAPEPHADTFRLFDELVDLDPAERRARLAALGTDPDTGRDVASLLEAAARAGDFLGVLRGEEDADPGFPDSGALVAGRYRIERHLGSGAMGHVHLAWDSQLERQVALKFLRADRTEASAAALARFRAEARAAARLDHPHVGTVYDIGHTADGRLFIAMAYYPGDTLRERIARAPLPPAIALRVAAQVAGALGSAHAAGIVHRDVKPANVLFDADGGARLTDFGIAKLLDEADGGDDVALGTPAYMSPEQVRGGPVDPGSDLWALGVMLHEMLTGQRPSTAGAARRTAPDPHVAPVPPSIGALIAELLADEPSRRPSRAQQVRESLEELLATFGTNAAPRAPVPGRGAMPVPVTSLVGRSGELATAERLLATSRLLTLTGPGGTGKSRLAIELGMRVLDRFPDGIWFVPLAEILDPALVPSSIAQTLGVRDLGTAPLRDRTITAIGERRLLLLLDNFEHVLEAAPFVAELLGACPNARVLVTSRATLNVQGEQNLPVPPLSTPSRDATYPDESDAVRLFVTRARAAHPGFAVNEGSLHDIGEICRRLDGLPLALELAAARSKLLSPRAILSRLEQRVDLLRADGGDRPVRHGTMRAVIDWSYILLSDAERMLFCRLAVFVGGISPAGAEAVAPPASPPAASVDAHIVLALLESLCTKSLLRAEEQPDGEPRFMMLETVRQFGLDRLAAGDDERAARRAHRSFFVAFAERQALRLRGPEQVQALDALERDYANFRLAFEGALEDGVQGLTDAARLGVALHRLWLIRGPLFEGIDQLRAIMDSLDASADSALDVGLRARVTSSAAHLAGTRSLFREARDLFSRSLVLHREAGDQAGIAATLNNLAWQVWNVGDLAAGQALSNEAMSIHEALGDELGVALSRNNLAWIAVERGEYAAAATHFQAVIGSHRRRGDARGAAFAMSWLGELEARRGNPAAAAALHEQALEAGDPVADLGYRSLVLVRLASARHALDDADDQAVVVETSLVPALRAFGRLWPLGYALAELGAMLLDRGDVARARGVLGEALDAHRSTGSAAGVIHVLLLMGTARVQADELRDAAALLADALDAAIEYDAAPLLIEALEVVSRLAFAAGQAVRAVALLAAANAARETIGMQRAPRAQRRDAAFRAALAATTMRADHERARAAGAASTLAQSIAEARSFTLAVREG